MTENLDVQHPHNKRPSALLSTCLCHTSPPAPNINLSRLAQTVEDMQVEGMSPTECEAPCRIVTEGKDLSYLYGNAAQNWFDQSNENPQRSLGQAIVDDDPPFFLRNGSSSSDEHVGVKSLDHRLPSTNHVAPHFPPGFLDHATIGSSVDDFRSVIDDLTIENKKLKERLRRYESLQSTHLDDDKLFEVKVHKLSPGEKRELEETLRSFAARITNSDSRNTQASYDSSKDEIHALRSHPRNRMNPSASSTSDSRPFDSGYASIATPGPSSMSVRYPAARDKYIGLPITKGKGQKTPSSLQDVPRRWIAKQPSVMDERAKKIAVVRRLEQLFTGEIDYPRGDHSHPLQQQEVSNNAARDDREENERSGGINLPEGTREAYILSDDMELGRITPPKTQLRSGTTSSDDNSVTVSVSLQQRPTRPLDLDPDRTQVPSDNINYIRHLGLPTPQLLAKNPVDVEADADGWVYLNVLMNMAQLHTISVTKPFVVSAISEFSDQFQLSPDGQKIRWRGGMQGTQFSSENDADSGPRGPLNDNDSLNDGIRKRRRIYTTFNQNTVLDQQPQHQQCSFIPVTGGRNIEASPKTSFDDFHYKPLFRHRLYQNHEEMSSDDGSMSSNSAMYTEPHRSNPQLRSHKSGQNRRGETIVFYSSAQFCTDLSGDRKEISTPLHPNVVDKDGFSKHTHDALGCYSRSLPSPPSRTPSGSLMTFRPFKDYSVCAPHPQRNEFERQSPVPVGSDSESTEFRFSPEWGRAEAEHYKSPIKMEASGLGGSQPADHFAVTVETSRTIVDSNLRKRLSKFSGPGPKTRKFLHSISKLSLDTFHSPQGGFTARHASMGAESPPSAVFNSGFVRAEILSAHVRRLEPSVLPPPANYYNESSDSTDSHEGTSSGSELDELGNLDMVTSSFGHASSVSVHEGDRMDEDD